MDLFLKGNEDPLPPSKQLHNFGVRDGAVLFMLQRAVWLWASIPHNPAVLVPVLAVL